MQNNRQPSPAFHNDTYWQHLDSEIGNLKKRTRRQFFAAAGGLLGGTALALGGMGVLTHSLKLPGQSANCAKTTAAINPNNPEVFKVCQINKSINFFPFYVAQQEGYFKAQGLTIATPTLMQVGSKVVSGVESGKFDIGNGVITDAFSWAIRSSQAQNHRGIYGWLRGRYRREQGSLNRRHSVSASRPGTESCGLKGEKSGSRVRIPAPRHS